MSFPLHCFQSMFYAFLVATILGVLGMAIAFRIKEQARSAGPDVQAESER